MNDLNFLSYAFFPIYITLDLKVYHFPLYDIPIPFC